MTVDYIKFLESFEAKIVQIVGKNQPIVFGTLKKQMKGKKKGLDATGSRDAIMAAGTRKKIKIVRETPKRWVITLP